MTFPTFGEFMTKLQNTFKAVNPVDMAMQKLALLQQGNRPVEELIMDFRLLIGDARLSTNPPSDQIHLIKMFMTCLNPQLKKIIFGDIVPKTIKDWYTKAIQDDSNYRLAQALQALDNQTTLKKTKNWFNQNQTQKDPNAMDIGATTTTTTTEAATSNGTVLIRALTEEMRYYVSVTHVNSVSVSVYHVTICQQTPFRDAQQLTTILSSSLCSLGHPSEILQATLKSYLMSLLFSHHQ